MDSEGKAELFAEERRKRLEEEGRAAAERIAEAQRRQMSKTQEMIRERQNRVEKTEERAAMIPGKMAERNRRLEERAMKRDERARVVVENQRRIWNECIERRKVKMCEEVEKSKAVIKVHREEVERKIEDEKTILGRRMEAAQQIFAEKDARLKEYEKRLDKRDITINGNRTEKEKEMRERLAAERLQLEQKTAAVKRARGASEAKRLAIYREKSARNSNEITEVKEQMAKSTLELAEEEEAFTGMKNAVVGIHAQLADMDESQQIKTLMTLLKLSGAEASEIVESAKKPGLIH
jgi:hypothetical protein